MASSDALTFERLLDWLEGRLSAQEQAAVAAQVAAADAVLQAEVAWARAFLQVGDLLIVEEPPPQVHHNLQQHFADHWQKQRASTVAAEAQPGFFQRLLAALTFDSYLQPGLVGVRGVQSPVTRQLIYSTSLADIALNLRQEPATGTLTLFGQILPTTNVISPDPTGAALPLSVSAVEALAVQLLQDEAEVDITLADPFGEFTFANLRPGVYALILSNDQLDLMLSPLTLTL